MARPRKPLAASFILHKTRKDRLESVTELNAWGQDIDDISILSQTPHIKLVALACNCLKSLGQFSQCLQLQQLLLRKNEVADIQELQHLIRLQHLRTLTLSENPVSNTADYRYKVLAALPLLTKLDDKEVLPHEVEEAQAQFPDILLTFISTDGASVGQTTVQASPSLSPLETPGASRRKTAADDMPAATPPAGRFSGPRRSLQQSDWGLDYPQQPQQQQQAREKPQQTTTPQQATPSGPLGRNPPHLTFSNDSGNSGAPMRSPQLQQHQQLKLPPPPPQQPQRLSFDGGRAPPEGAFPAVVPLQWQESSTMHPQQLQQAGPPHQQQPTSEAPKSDSGGTADNVFYAVVALLPELSLKHLQWARDEIDARMLEVQQDDLRLGL